MKNKLSKICWLFCNVIDNFGDVGVSWRLAKALQARLNWHVYFFLDDWDSLRQLAPDYEYESGITVKRWCENVSADVVGVLKPDVVIEAFACRLPEEVLLILKNNGALWLNWEYLSAQDWAIRTHGMQSLQADGYAKYFWQMGFVEQSGGLIREQDFNPLSKSVSSNRLKVLLFGYESVVWADTLNTWQALGLPLDVDWVGWQVGESLYQSGWFANRICDECVSGSLKIRRIDFVPQIEFDDLLAQYDWLFVRGEDSFVRAQFSGRPFFWHIYPQDEWIHLEKLNAFWDKVWLDGYDWQKAHQALSDELNGATRLSEDERLGYWQILWKHCLDWQQGALNWQKYLLEQSDAVSRLALWCDLHNNK